MLRRRADQRKNPVPSACSVNCCVREKLLKGDQQADYIKTFAVSLSMSSKHLGKDIGRVISDILGEIRAEVQ